MQSATNATRNKANPYTTQSNKLNARLSVSFAMQRATNATLNQATMQRASDATLMAEPACVAGFVPRQEITQSCDLLILGVRTYIYMYRVLFHQKMRAAALATADSQATSKANHSKKPNAQAMKRTPNYNITVRTNKSGGAILETEWGQSKSCIHFWIIVLIIINNFVFVGQRGDLSLRNNSLPSRRPWHWGSRQYCTIDASKRNGGT